MSEFSVTSPLGWRARLGLVVPQLDVVTEALFPHLLPSGVSLHTARMRRTGPASSESLTQMNAGLDAALELLPLQFLDAVVYHCTTGSLLYGPDRLAETITEKTGLPTISTSAALVKALRHFSAKRICLVTPYPKDLNEAEIAFFEAAGFSVPRLGGVNLSDTVDITRVTGEEIAAWVRRAYTPDCDMVVISCTALRSHGFLRELEQQLGCPVVTSASVVLWDIYNYLRVPAAALSLGRLFDDAG